MSRMFSITARVCRRMSSRVVPSESTSAPAMVLSARRALVPEINRKSPARLMCGYFPRGTAFPSTTLLSVALIFFQSNSQPDANIVQFGIKIQGMHPAFAANAREACSTERRSKIAQKPAVHPRDAHIYLLCDTMTAFQVGG